MHLEMALAPLLETRGLTKEYRAAGLLSKPVIFRSVDDVDFHIARSSATALVGASGSGKSTLSRCLVGLERPTSGQVLYQGTDISTMDRVQLRDYRRKVQIVFQEAAGTINPRFTAGVAVSEPLKILGIGNSVERKRQARYWIEQVGLSAEAADRPALEFSGGEQQRIAIARVLIKNPEVIIFDES